jgi:probable phosphoglycerate mutase
VKLGDPENAPRAMEAGPHFGPASGASPGGSGDHPSTGVPALILVRHGETEWSRSGQHTGRTDIALTADGEEQARAAGQLVRRLLRDRTPSLVVSSPRRRALHTAELAGFPVQTITEDAAEWDYGSFEGLTSRQIQQSTPHWSIWDGPVPGGEDAAAITARIDRLLESVMTSSAQGPVLVFSHGHASRCMAARWLGQPVATGRFYWLSTGAVSSLGYEHDRPVILRWNLDKALEGPTP